MSPELLRVYRAYLKRSKAEGEWRAAVLAAHAAGISLREIGKAAGISHVRVLQITREH